jgi:hypothetical protein
VTRKKDIGEAILGEWARDAGAYKTVIADARRVLRDVWGFDLVEIPKGVDAGTGASAKATMNASQAAAAVAAVQARAASSGAPVHGINNKSGIFTLISALPPSARRSIPKTEADEHESGFLALLLVLIHLSKGKRLGGAQLATQLARLGFNAGESHPVIGKWEAMISRFVAARYLQRVAASAAGEAAGGRGPLDDGTGAAADLNATQANQLRQITDYAFAVGPRSAAEIDERTLMRIVGWVYGEEDVDRAIRKDLARRKLELTQAPGADLDLEARERIEDDPVVDAFDEEASMWRALTTIRNGGEKADGDSENEGGHGRPHEEEEEEEDEDSRPRRRRRR